MKKRYLAVFFALIIVLACVPVFAAGTGTLTIKNATPGKTYSVYKIFDLTHSGDAYAYSIGSSSDWYEEVNTAGSPFKLTKIEGGDDKFTVSFDSETVAFEWLKAKAAAIENKTLAIEADHSMIADTGSLKFTGLDFGYYFVTSEMGSAVTIHNLAQNIEIIDKNQSAHLTGKKVSSTGAEGSWAESNSAGIGDTLYFKIEAFVPMYIGDKEVFDYIFTDTLGPGLTLDEDSVELKLGDQVLLSPYHYEVEVIEQEFSIRLKVYESAGYPTDAGVVISYEASVNKDAVHENINSLSMTWTEYNPEGPPTAAEDGPPPAETTTYVYGFVLNKYKEAVAPANLLEGAEFKLYDEESACNEIDLVKTADGQYRPALTAEEGVKISAGTAEIFGLARGTYWLEETRAPDGYNRLAGRVKVEITEENSSEGYLTDGIDIINKAGIALPATGGIGSIIFYFAGSALMLAALIIFLKKIGPAFTKKVD